MSDAAFAAKIIIFIWPEREHASWAFGPERREAVPQHSDRMFAENFGYDVYRRRQRAPNFFINAIRIEHGVLPTVKRSCNNGSHPGEFETYDFDRMVVCFSIVPIGNQIRTYS